jgi:signal transduction histidine kinase
MPGAQEVDGELLGELLDWLREPVVITDPLGKIVRASRSAAVALGSPPQLEGMLFVTFVAPDDRRRFRRVLQAAAARRAVEVVLRPPEAPTFLARLEVERTDQRLYWSIGFGEASDELQRGLGRLIEGLSEGLAVVDRALRVGLANRAALQLLGVETGARLPRRWGEFDLETFVAALFDVQAMHAEAIVAPGDGLYTLSGMPTRGRRHALLLVADTTAREQRERREREFVANAAHELQTPLTAILGAVEVLEAGAKDDADARDRFLTHLRRESERLVRLVQSLLLLAEADSGTARARDLVPVRELLDDAASRLQVREGVRVEVLAPPGLDVVTHRALAGRAVGTLAENAAKHTREGRILLVGRSGRHGIVLEVHDTGPGMPESVRARAFDRFYRGERDGDGFGLGLSIAWQAANALGGTLELDSAPGAGTVARLVLPRVRTA